MHIYKYVGSSWWWWWLDDSRSVYSNTSQTGALTDSGRLLNTCAQKGEKRVTATCLASVTGQRLMHIQVLHIYIHICMYILDRLSVFICCLVGLLQQLNRHVKSQKQITFERYSRANTNGALVALSKILQKYIYVLRCICSVKSDRVAMKALPASC